MRSNVESHLKHLKSSKAPADLRARCLATMPQKRGVAHKPMHRTPAWRLQRFALAGGLLLATAVGSAFWSTRPTSENGQSISGSVALAQAIEEMRNIKAFHIIGKTRNIENGSWQSNDWAQTESWFDEERGAYSILTNSPYRTALLPLHFAKTIYSLALPDGTFYERGNSQFVVEKNAKQWTMMKGEAKDALVGDIATTQEGAERTRFAYPGGDLRLKSTEMASWQGQETKVFIFECRPMTEFRVTRDGTPTNDVFGKPAPAMRKKIYVDAATDRVVANQEFALFDGKEPQLLAQMEVDYKTPDAALFDAAKIKEGATQVSRSNPNPHP